MRYLWLLTACLLTTAAWAQEAPFDENARAELRRQVFTLCQAGKEAEAMAAIEAHALYPAADANPLIFTEDQRWLFQTRRLVEMRHDLLKPLFNSGTLLRGQVVRGPLAGKAQARETVSGLIMIVDDRVELATGLVDPAIGNSRPRADARVTVTLTELAELERVKLALKAWEKTDQAGGRTHSAAFLALSSTVTYASEIRDLLARRDHLMADFLEAELVHYRAVATVPTDELPAWYALRAANSTRQEALRELRSSDGREVAWKRYGGSRAGQVAVDKSLAWLAKVQNPDGSWPGPNAVACTGMALLVFFAHGETQDSETYGTTVEKATKWLATQMIETPDNKPCGGRAYSHAIATLALAEASIMTQMPVAWIAMNKGLTRIIAGQQSTGGFDYQYKGAGQVAKWDLSVSGWQFQAMIAGYDASSDVPGLLAAIDKAVSFLKEEAYGYKKFGYSKPGTGGNMTGVGTLSLQNFGARDSAQARGGVETIASERLNLYRNILVGKSDWKTDGGRNIYGWYYDTQAMFNAQGKEWREWQTVYEKVLISQQHPDGDWAAEGHGFNDKNDAGRILSTCWCALQLEVYYRYLPTYRIGRHSP